MKIIDQLKNRNTLIYLGVLIIGILLGWLFFGGGSAPAESGEIHEGHTVDEHKASTVYTCAMHPQIRESKPGKCPICGMELVPLAEEEDDGEVGDYTVKLTNSAMKIAEVSTSVIQKAAPYKEVYLPGKVVPDERRISELTSRFPGRIEKLYVNFTGQKVKEGQILAQVYSPELVTAQKELFEAMKLKETNPNYYKAVRNKLKLWDLTETQIDNIANSGEVKFYFDVLSPLTGTVTMRHVALGDYIKEGAALFEIIDLSRVWVMFDAYESDIPWIKIGDKIKFTIKSIPSEEFESTVTFIDPVINPHTRVAGVRAELRNPKDLLKPQMLASGLLKTMLPGSGDQLIIPKSAILWTGKKAVVYVRTNDHDNMFLYTEISLGADAGEYYVVKEGLNEGDLVASNGVFKIDAAAQLKGERSMMNPEGGKQSMGGHAGMDMGGGDKKSATEEHKGHETTASEGQKKMVMSVDENFKKQLGAVYSTQLNLKNEFVNSNSSKVTESASLVEGAIGNVDMSLVTGEMHNLWMGNMKVLNRSLDQIKSSDDIEEQRLAYADFIDELYKAIKMFGVSGVTIYYQFCPMARDGKGAYWLSETEEIKNPYYGEAMLTCGETKEVIQ
jgi:Cu(I)/Ag(I) efflux system membrane fusion protein